MCAEIKFKFKLNLKIIFNRFNNSKYWLKLSLNSVIYLLIILNILNIYKILLLLPFLLCVLKLTRINSNINKKNYI